MAEDRATAYANWIVRNQDKKGTAEFETVANAYRQLRGEVSAPAEQATPQGPGKMETAERGFTQGFLGNFADELGGLAAASPLGGEQKAKVGTGNFNPIDAALGGARILGEDYGLWGDGSARKTYETELARQRQADAAAQEANPGTAIVSGIAGAVANPLMRAAPAPAATIPGRIAQGAALGAGQGAVYGAGAGEGGIVDRIEKASSGALAGGLVGGAATGAIEAAVPAARAVAGKVRAIVNPDEQAARVASRSIQEDIRNGTAGLSPQDYADAVRRGDPVVLADMGGARTMSAARSAANTSPEARGAFDAVNDARLQTQGDRVNDTLRQAMGESDATGTAIVPYDPASGAGTFRGGARISASDDLDALAAKAKVENAAKYEKAHADAAGADLWDAEFQRLAAAPPVRKAIKEVLEMGDTAAVVQGGRPIRSPFTRGRDGEWRIRATQRADGTMETVRPNLEFWDHVQRKLRAQAENLGTDKYAAGQIGALRNALLRKVDGAVPTFREAREGAAKFFGAADAHEAGMKFFNPQGALQMGQAQKAINRMSKSERELFARGYAAQFSEMVDRAADKNTLLNKFLQNKQSRLRMQMALGPRRAAQVEARFRVESIMDRLRQSMGNSSTARQLAELGIASGAGAGLGYAQSGWSGATLGALGGAAVRFGAKKVDARTAERVGKILASQDPAALQRLAQAAASDAKVMNAIRAFESVVARLGGGETGARVPGVPLLGRGPMQADQADENRQGR